MLRFFPHGHASAAAPLRHQGVTITSSAAITMTLGVTGALQLQPRRAYVTGTRSTARERRYYTQPLRAPQYGASTIVGRLKSETGMAPAAATTLVEAPSPMAEGIATGLSHGMVTEDPDSSVRGVTTDGSLKMRLVHFIASYCQPVRYNDAGVPVEGSLLRLPWREQLRLCTAILAALYMTKAFFGVARFELLYYGVWKVSYRNDSSLMKRLLYYGSTAMLAAGLLLCFDITFFLSACLVGRREIAGYMLCNAFSKVMPRRALQLLDSRIGC
ncbi:hypothetical protein LSCM1_06237 [Leishmania martiniquensis]|uniref:Uncharacterized protein n=1 Tax=Leishmania martiniquensis TaxID=1580590 RepID=A0A836GWQ4_9TRYP|nr:hypothetical protein LSCM1_06237 [Leishmania martiniquensis]